jgi:hypothetical protein
MDEQALALVRSAMRTDLTSIGAVPTAAGIQMIAHADQALGFALVCEAVYVQLYHSRPPEAILAYLEGPLQIRDAHLRQYILRTALRVRAALATHAGERSAALRRLMTERGAEQAVVEGIIEACTRTAGEFAIPWSAAYFPGYGRPGRPGRSGERILGVVILAGSALALLYGLHRLIWHLTS